MKPTISKTFHKDGRWIVNPLKTVIWVCVCGYKYIKTREGQSSCLRCAALAREKEDKRE